MCVLLHLLAKRGSNLTCNVLRVNFPLPSPPRCKAIDSVEKDDDTQWLTYWVVYAAFGILEYFTDLLLSWIPFYFLLKVRH